MEYSELETVIYDIMTERLPKMSRSLKKEFIREMVSELQAQGAIEVEDDWNSDEDEEPLEDLTSDLAPYQNSDD